MCHTGINCKNDLILYATNKTALFMKYDTGRVESVSGDTKPHFLLYHPVDPTGSPDKH